MLSGPVKGMSCYRCYSKCLTIPTLPHQHQKVPGVNTSIMAGWNVIYRNSRGLRSRDVQATLAELTAVTISEQVLLSGGCDRLMVCGGGSRNPLVMARLAGLLPGTEVTTTDTAGISGDDMEALAFAWLARRTLAGLAGNLPSVTGASEATVLGAIFPANPSRTQS